MATVPPVNQVPPAPTSGIFKLSIPTQEQVIHGAERTLVVFVLAFAAYLKTTSDPTSKAALIGAGYAAVAAVYQAVLSVLTTL